MKAQKLSDTLNLQQLEEIVITAQYTPELIKASVYPIKVIDQNEIRARGATNLRELLYHELNLQLEQKSVFGASPEVQGVARENVKILIDGVPVIGRLNGIIDLTQLPLDEIKQVEIIEGPSSVYYGTNALAGVINLITYKYQKESLTARIEGYYETIGQFNLNGKIGLRNKSKKDLLRLAVARNYFDGHALVDTMRLKEWESRDQYLGNLYYIHYFNKVELSNTTNFFNEELIHPGQPDAANTTTDTYYQTNRWKNDLTLKGQLANNKYLDLTFSYSDYLRYNNDYHVDLNNGESLLSDKASDHDTTHFDFWFFKGQYSKGDSSKFNFTLGYDLNAESTEGGRILNKKQSMQDYAFFASTRYRPAKTFIFQPGLRFTFNSIFSPFLAPAVNLKWDPGNNTQFRASWAQGYRAPSLKELYLDFHMSSGPFTYHILGNQELNVEHSNNFNLALSHQLKTNSNQTLNLNLSSFYNEINNMIALSDMVDFTRFYVNINRHKTYGGKAELRYIPIQTLSLSGGLSRIARYNHFTEDYAVPVFVATTNLNGSLSYCFPKQKASASIFYKYNGVRPGFIIDKSTGEIIETLRQPYQVMDASVTKTFRNNSFHLTMGAKNLLNVTNIETIGNQSGQAHGTELYLWGRSAFVRLQFRF
ncbi:MAG: TonB-dependent receptor [Cyclobacteriaceae bacterium]|nr:TonB-dependent receptor [Cyclobacteriaceae bacterium]